MNRYQTSLLSLWVSVALGACGGDDNSQTCPSCADAASTVDATAGTPDAATGSADASPDAPPGLIAEEVNCAAVTPAGTIVVDGVASNDVTVAAGQVVQFNVGGDHTSWGTNGEWSLGGATSCLRFYQPGTYTGYCYFHAGDPHGSITVTP